MISIRTIAFSLVRDGGWTDTWNAASKRANEGYNTFHGYNRPGKSGHRIDWILTRDTPKRWPRGPALYQ